MSTAAVSVSPPTVPVMSTAAVSVSQHTVPICTTSMQLHGKVIQLPVVTNCNCIDVNLKKAKDTTVKLEGI